VPPLVSTTSATAAASAFACGACAGRRYAPPRCAAQPIAFNARHTCTCTAFGRDGSLRISRLRVSIERTLHACSNHFNYGAVGGVGRRVVDSCSPQRHRANRSCRCFRWRASSP